MDSFSCTSNTGAGEHVASATYLWLLRTGVQRDNPAIRHLPASATFLGVPSVYFLPATSTQEFALPQNS